jgi:hypothetical protein
MSRHADERAAPATKGVTTKLLGTVDLAEHRNTRHWLENRGAIPAVEISVDIVRQP